MKALLLQAIFLAVFVFTAHAQHEFAPLQEKEINYKDWTFKSIRDGKELNLRELTNGKKLVLVIYFAPWCPNWKLQAPVAQKFYEKYKDNGLEIIGVGEYDSVDAMKTSLETYKVTFPAVFESDSRGAKQQTTHYEYRRLTGDTRNWGSPWSIFLETSKLEKKGSVLVKKTFIVNGELIEAETEAFIREKLGLPKDDTTAGKSAEICQPSTTLKKPL